MSVLHAPPRSLGSIAPKVGNLIRRLGSNFDGEIIATVGALRRVLESVDLDLNDLADIVEANECRPGTRRSSTDSPPIWRSLSPMERAEWLAAVLVNCELSDWEAKFATDMRARASLFPNWIVTPKQIAQLDRILLNAWSSGVRP